MVAKAKRRLPPHGETADLTAFFDAFSDNTRARIMLALAGGRLCVCDISQTLGMSVSAVSHQLRVLRALNLVSYSAEGRQAFYKLADQHVSKVLQLGLSHVREKYPGSSAERRR
ncbi:MAG TPA: transcriptional regulator [Elusimicrobia bacterium]|nr:transcriptional regulator [Elusimicrobiota bacterium]